jgi:hypothetical protein
MLDVHAKALQTASGPYHEFLLMYQAYKPVVYGFVEGKEDPSFYRGFIEYALPEVWAVRFICAGNRSAVLETISAFPWDRFPRKRICFFVDRDLSDYLNEKLVQAENLYVTDNYSIENDVVCEHTFCRVIEEVFGIARLNEAELEDVRNAFTGNLSFFCETMTPIMAQILIWRREGARAALANIKPQALFFFKDGKGAISSDFSSSASRVLYAAESVGLPASDAGDLRAAEQEFRDKGGASRFVRGKYLIWFFVEYAAALHGAIAGYCPRYPKPPKLRVTLGAANAMTIVGPRAKAPASLKRFIETNYIEHIASVEMPPQGAPRSDAS